MDVIYAHESPPTILFVQLADCTPIIAGGFFILIAIGSFQLLAQRMVFFIHKKEAALFGQPPADSITR